MSAALASIATDLETAAGATTSANPSPAGYWSRIAEASEVLADATTSANATISGYMLRAALALESLAGTDGNEENASYFGYLKRIVDALEVQSGSVETGSLIHRLVLAAENATFGPADPYGPNLVLNGTFDGDDATGWTLSRCSISSNALQLVNSTGLNGLARYAFEALEDGATYLIEFEVSNWVSLGGASHNGFFGGVSFNFHPYLDSNGAKSFQAVAGAAADTMQIACNNNDSMTLDNFSVRKVL